MVKRPVQTGFNRFFTGPQIPKIVKTEDRTTVFGLLRSWEFAVLIGLGPVQSRSFSSYKTGLPNTRQDRRDNKKQWNLVKLRRNRGDRAQSAKKYNNNNTARRTNNKKKKISYDPLESYLVCTETAGCALKDARCN